MNYYLIAGGERGCGISFYIFDYAAHIIAANDRELTQSGVILRNHSSMLALKLGWEQVPDLKLKVLWDILKKGLMVRGAVKLWRQPK